MRLPLRSVVIGAAIGSVVVAWQGPATSPQTPAQAEEVDTDAWEIPAEFHDRKNPVARSEEAMAHARVLWREHCYSCHGKAGKGDGPDARMHERRKHHAPRDLTDPRVQENLTDGEIFYRITKGVIEAGNVLMPAYEQKLPNDAARWLLVHMVRELGKTAGAK